MPPRGVLTTTDLIYIGVVMGFAMAGAGAGLIEVILGYALDFDFAGFAKHRDPGDDGGVAVAIVFERQAFLDINVVIFDGDCSGYRSAATS